MTRPVPVVIEQPAIQFHNTARSSIGSMTWNDYVGQDAVKAELRIFIDAAMRTGRPMPHTLLHSGMPGQGKTALAELIAQEMQSNLLKLAPPFTPETLYQALLACGDCDVLLIDEIHKMADHGPAMAERLLHVMEENRLYLEDRVFDLRDLTIVGATTNAAKLPRAVVDRFTVKPEFAAYTLVDLLRIIRTNFCRQMQVTLLPETMVAIAKACRQSPREARHLVVTAAAMQDARQRPCTPDDLLGLRQLEPDGTSRKHIAYLCVLYQFFGRERDEEWEYVAGEMSLMNVLDEDKPGLARLERFLIERGLVDRTPRGRRLTDRGICKAREYVARGLGRSTE